MVAFEQPNVRLKAIKRDMTLGADPEIFAFEGNALLPAYEFLPSKKQAKSHQAPANDFKSYWDGFQAEFSFDSGYTCIDLLVGDLAVALDHMQESVERKSKTAKLSFQNVVRVPTNLLETAEDKYIELGCKPSYNAYGLHGKAVQNPRELRYRFAGGHMHFGSWLKKPKYDHIVKILDATLGVWSIGAAKSLDNPVRRQYYGLPGEYRKPMYNGSVIEKFGLEYRTLSNFWLCHPAIVHLTFELGRAMVRLANSRLVNLLVIPEQDVIEAITNCDTRLAGKILKLNWNLIKWAMDSSSNTFKRQSKKFSVSEKGLQLGLDGIESVVDDPNDHSANWNIDKLNDLELRWARFAQR